MRILAEEAASGGRLPVRGVFERSDVDVRQREGLAKASGRLFGEEPPPEIEIEERAVDGRALRFLVDVRRGHKTGFYLDQSRNRREVASWCAGREVLDLFCYTGGLGVHAMAAGAAHVVQVDSSVEAIAAAQRTAALNGFAAREEDFQRENVFEIMRRFRSEGRKFGAVIADPPKLAKTQANVEKSTRAYKDLNHVAMQLLEPGGILATFSCSGLVSGELFRKVVFGASVDAGREVQVLDRLATGGPPGAPELARRVPERVRLPGGVTLASPAP